MSNITIEAQSFRDASDKSPVFDPRDTVVDEEGILKAQARHEAIKAYNSGKATEEQVMLLRDLDDAINQRGRYAPQAAHAQPPAPAPAPAPAPVVPHTVPSPAPRPAPQAPQGLPPGYRPPPQHSRYKR